MASVNSCEKGWTKSRIRATNYQKRTKWGRCEMSQDTRSDRCFSRNGRMGKCTFRMQEDRVAKLKSITMHMALYRSNMIQYDIYAPRPIWPQGV